MSRVLVTGADGFIGSHLVDALVRKGCDVKAMIHYSSRETLQNLPHLRSDVLQQVEIYKGEITDPVSVNNAVSGCSKVFHLAALIGIPYSYIAPGSYVSTNVVGTLNVLEAARRYEVERVVHTSTSETYGSAQYTPMDEKHPLVGQSPYSASKIAADSLAESYWRSFQLPVTILRPFNTYGPRQSARAIIPTVAAQALIKGEIVIGSLSPIRDLTFVSDTVAGFIAASVSKNVVGETVNLGFGKGVSVGELAEKIRDLVDLDIEIKSSKMRVRPTKSEVSCLISNNSRAKSLMGWSPKVSLEDGLKETIRFVRENPSRFKIDSYTV